MQEPITAVVKRFYPNTNHGFLENPDSQKGDIFFHVSGRYKRKGSQYIPVASSPTRLRPGHKVHLISVVDLPEGPRATCWRLMG